MALDIDAIEARAKAATEGPWLVHTWFERRNVVEAQPYFEERPGVSMAGQRILAQEVIPPDADFIAAARSDIPLLLAELRAIDQLIMDCAEGTISAQEARHALRKRRGQEQAGQAMERA